MVIFHSYVGFPQKYGYRQSVDHPFQRWNFWESASSNFATLEFTERGGCSGTGQWGCPGPGQWVRKESKESERQQGQKTQGWETESESVWRTVLWWHLSVPPRPLPLDQFLLICVYLCHVAKQKHLEISGSSEGQRKRKRKRGLRSHFFSAMDCEPPSVSEPGLRCEQPKKKGEKEPWQQAPAQAPAFCALKFLTSARVGNSWYLIHLYNSIIIHLTYLYTIIYTSYISILRSLIFIDSMCQKVIGVQQLSTRYTVT